MTKEAAQMSGAERGSRKAAEKVQKDLVDHLGSLKGKAEQPGHEFRDGDVYEAKEGTLRVTLARLQLLVDSQITEDHP
jgi:hypothetical protein